MDGHFGARLYFLSWFLSEAYKMSKRILMLSHNAARDYHTDTLLVHELRKRGHHVWLNHFLQDDGNRISIIKPDIVILPEIRCEYSRFLAEQCRSYGIQVVVKMCEFGISEESLSLISPAYKQAIFGRFSVGHCVDKFLAWGPKMKTMMVEHMNIAPEKIIVCGGFQFDAYFLPPPPKLKHDTDKKVILFAGGFPYADRNPEFSMPEAEADDPVQAAFVQTDGSNRSKWLKFIPEFIKEFGDKWYVVVKPHPGERTAPYEMFMKGLEGKIILDVAGIHAIEGVDFVVHAGSTMAYEAYLRKIPSINFCNNCQDVVVSAISPCADTPEDFISLFKEMTAGDTPVCAYNGTVLDVLHRDYYGTVDGQGYVRMANAICDLPTAVTNVPDQWQYPQNADYPSKDVLSYVEQWKCDGCKHVYFVSVRNREMCKCPYCGIANIKVQ